MSDKSLAFIVAAGFLYLHFEIKETQRYLKSYGYHEWMREYSGIDYDRFEHRSMSWDEYREYNKKPMNIINKLINRIF